MLSMNAQKVSNLKVQDEQEFEFHDLGEGEGGEGFSSLTNSQYLYMDKK